MISFLTDPVPHEEAIGLIADKPAVAAGSIILNTTTGKLNFYTGSTWEAITSAP
jgi:hypothetical protein